MTGAEVVRVIRPMRRAELDIVLDWAAQEGWNPGLDDAQAFYDTDPQGFFVAEVSGALVAAISVVNHDADRAFLGLYICVPAYRGQGHGLALWSEALRHAGGRAVGLEGVPAQQENYRRSGFAPLGRTLRFCGHIARKAPRAEPTGVEIAGAADLAALRQADQRAVGYARDAYCAAWFQPGARRKTCVLRSAGAIRGHATFRICQEGVKIGPFHAGTQADAVALLQSCPVGFPSGPLFVDAPEGSALEALLRARGFEPMFETAQMVRGAPAAADPPAYYALATLELG